MEQVEGYVERISYQNEENGFTVLLLKCKGNQDPICVVGKFTSVNVGETLQCEGVWTRHPVHGRQFDCKSHQVKAPSDIVGIKKYLGSGLIKGIGPAYASRIVDAFGIDTLDIIDRLPEKLNEIAGLGKKRIAQILSCWSEQKVIRDVMVFLQGHGVSPAYAQKIFKIYGTKCIQVVKDNPYQLARDVHGIGFKIADDIAKELGILQDATVRIDAGIEYVLRELADEGHVCYPEHEFLKLASETLGVLEPLILSRMDVLQTENRIERFPLIITGAKKSHVWFKPYFNAEIGIAKELQRLREAPSALRTIDIQKALIWVQSKLNITLAPAQLEAVSQSCIGKLLIITGGPGTGKSTITNAILKITEQLTSRILLAAPTGRAAKRMSEITGKPAKTIHSLLEYDFRGGFKRKKDNPLECDLLIVDESSMIDTLLMHHLLKAVPSSARVIFVGDIHQLPSVGPGTVLQDMIQSMQIPVVTLNEIFRQAQGSMIITNAHKINRGQFPQIHNSNDSDFFFIEAETPEEVLQNIVKLVAVRLPKKYDLNAIDQIQVLSPMKRGVAGIENLNTVLQEQLNPQKDALFKAGRRYHVGDKVMQIKNNYKKNIYNGDVGRIKAIDLDEQQMIVQFDENEIIYEFNELDELVLAYAVSVHKYQGSECPCIVMPVHTTHAMLLQRNLLYTGVTRGKKLVVLVGTTKALSMAVRNDEIKQRHTGLRHALMGYLD